MSRRARTYSAFGSRTSIDHRTNPGLADRIQCDNAGLLPLGVVEICEHVGELARGYHLTAPERAGVVRGIEGSLMKTTYASQRAEPVQNGRNDYVQPGQRQTDIY